MAYNLAGLLGKTDMSMNGLTDTFESLCGFPSEDVRLLSEIASDNRRKLVSLGLDPNDTTAEELYHALLIKYDEADNHFDRAVNQNHSAGIDKKLQKACQVVAHTGSHPHVWALKRSVAKDILRAHPPRKLIRHLRYRTLESMLKRENITELYAAAVYLESPRWRKLLSRSLAMLSVSDYEIRAAEVVSMPAKRWSSISHKTSLVTPVPHIGAVALWPGSAANTMSILGICAVTLQSIRNLAQHTLPAKLHQFQPGFSKRFADLASPAAAPLKLAGHNVGWRSLATHYSKQPEAHYPQAFDPHIEAADFCRDDPACLLSSISPSLLWWSDNSYLLFRDKKGTIVSLNLVDVAINRSAGLSFKKRNANLAQKALWDELISRYLAHRAVENRLTSAIEEYHTSSTNRKPADPRRARQKVRLA